MENIISKEDILLNSTKEEIQEESLKDIFEEVQEAMLLAKNHKEIQEDVIEEVIEEAQEIIEEEKVKKTLKKKASPANSKSSKLPKTFKKGVEHVARNINYYKIDISGIPSYINTVQKFMQLHPEFFRTNVNKKMIYIHDNSIYHVYSDPVIFKDIIHNTKGFIQTSFSPENKEFTMILNIKTIQKSTSVHNCYIKQIEAYVLDQSKNGDRVELHYNKILSDNMVKHCFYTQSFGQWEQDVKILKDEFFLPGKDRLLSIINSKTNTERIGNTTNSWNNLILSGPYGSGKSSFIYRVSMMLKLNIVSIDLSLFLNKKKELYALMYGQEFCLPNSTVKEPALNNCIIALEELDTAIEKLIDIENIFKYKDILKKDYLRTKNKELKEQAMAFAQKSDDHEIDEEIKNDLKNISKPVKVMAENYEDFLQQEMLQDGIDLKSGRIGKDKMDIFSKRSHDNELNSINLELDNIIKAMDTDNKSNILRMSDLLELFSPSSPVKGRIIIGTTNHLAKMKKTIPPLFRAGRLTNIEFSYLDWKSLNQLAQYYFGKTMTVNKFVVNIPTSEVVEMAVKFSLGDEEDKEANFDTFEQELLERCCSCH